MTMIEDSDKENGPGADENGAPEDSNLEETREAGETEGPKAPSLEEVAEQAAQVTRDILAFFPRVPDPNVTWNVQDGSAWVEIEGDPSGRLIGRKGQTIDAFEHIVSKIISHRLRKKTNVHLDAENYRKRHREKLVRLAEQTADYVAATKGARALEPMGGADRRFVHIALKERRDVITASEGRDPSRFVVIWPSEDE